MSSSVKPSLNIQEIQDPDPQRAINAIRRNFELLKQYFEEQNQLQDFRHLVISIDSAQTNVKIAHSLGFVPRDILKTKKTGSGTIRFNRSLFDETFIDVTTTGAVEFRGFFGTFIKDDSTPQSEDVESF